MNDIRPGMHARWIPGGRSRIVYRVEKVQKFGETEYALLTWMKNTLLPGAMWVKVDSLKKAYEEVDNA